MRIAVPCPGLGHVWRGFESHALDLVAALKDDVQIVAYGAAAVPGAGERVRSLPAVTRTGRLAHLLIPARQRYRVEQLSFALAFAARLKGRGADSYDVLHVSDTLVGLVLQALRPRLGLRFRVVLSNGGNREPALLRRFDFSQMLTPMQREGALRAGIPESRQALVPYGLDCSAFARQGALSGAARSRLGLPADKRIILAVSPLGLDKRLEYVVREIAALGRGDLFLLVVGQPTETAEVVREEAQRLLPGRHRLLSLPYTEMRWAYQAADLFAHGALAEGFGRVILEAMAAGLPLVVHDFPLFGWLVPDPLARVDMTREGALAGRLRDLLDDSEAAAALAAGNLQNVVTRFDWSSLRGEYLRMWEASLACPVA